MKVFNRFLRSLYAAEDFLFERKYGLDLSGYIPPDLLSAQLSEGVRHSNGYQATWCYTLRKLYSHARKTGIEFENFIDIGSGKGKPCLYMALSYKFSRYIGVEFSKELLSISNLNKKKINRDDIEFKLVDATKFILPDGNSLIFIFNSFDSLFLRKFILLNMNHFKNYKTVIGYSNDLHKDVLSELNFKCFYSGDKMSLHRYG